VAASRERIVVASRGDRPASPAPAMAKFENRNTLANTLPGTRHRDHNQ
jgi:hypothetical protein